MKTSLIAALALATLAAAPAPIDTKRMSDDVRVLASDAYQGRAPGTPGEDKTVAWLIARFKALGLQPGGERGRWTQAVPMIHTRAGTPSLLEFRVGSAAQPLVQAKDISANTVQPTSQVKIDRAPLVFVGYGVSAPERGWDDYKGVDLKGKIAVYLVNDPDFEAKPGEPVAGKFGGRTMTYYGRWTYKYEEAARQGALGALIIHDTPGAGYAWTVAASAPGENYDLAPGPGVPKRVQIQGWLNGDVAAKLFQAAGLDLPKLREQARRADFRPVALKDATFSVDMPVKMERIESRNVLARLPGKTRPNETVMIAGHWDAYGIGAPDKAGRTVRPGANDDALGIAAMMEIARSLKALPQPDRSIVFAAWTAEERNLLGSQAYAARPIYPVETTVADFTFDIMNTAGPSRDVVLIGKGQNDLEDDLARAAVTQGRTVTAETLPERGLFYRADHFPMARRGVPVLLMMAFGGGPDLVEGGRAAGDKWVADLTRDCYHQTCDAWDPKWDLRGAAQDTALVRDMVLSLANSTRWPQWRPSSEFRSTRDASAKSRRP